MTAITDPDYMAGLMMIMADADMKKTGTNTTVVDIRDFTETVITNRNTPETSVTTIFPNTIH